MNKQNIFIVFLSLLLSAVTAFSTVIFFEEEKVTQSVLPVSQLTEESTRNSDMIKQLLFSVSELKGSVYDLKEKPVIQMKEPLSSQSSGIEQLKIVTKQLANMQQQINDFKQSIISLERSGNMKFNLPVTVDMNKNDLLKLKEELYEKDEMLQQKAVETYESVLNDGQKDIAWENNVEDGVKQVIELNESSSDAQLEDINCQDTLCRVTLSTSKSPMFLDDIIFSLGEGVNTYMQTEKDSGNTVLYISRKNEDLPSIDGIN